MAEKAIKVFENADFICLVFVLLFPNEPDYSFFPSQARFITKVMNSP
jgi:hypothetical protein